MVKVAQAGRPQSNVIGNTFLTCIKYKSEKGKARKTYY